MCGSKRYCPKITAYVDHLLRETVEAKTINCYLNSICQFYHYLSKRRHPDVIP